MGNSTSSAQRFTPPKEVYSNKSPLKLFIIVCRVASVSWILSFGLRAHLKKDNYEVRMISSIFLFYMMSLLLLLAFESTTRYIIIMYYMVLLSNMGALFMMRALQKSV